MEIIARGLRTAVDGSKADDDDMRKRPRTNLIFKTTLEDSNVAIGSLSQYSGPYSYATYELLHFSFITGCSYASLI